MSGKPGVRKFSTLMDQNRDSLSPFLRPLIYVGRSGALTTVEHCMFLVPGLAYKLNYMRKLVPVARPNKMRSIAFVLWIKILSKVETPIMHRLR